MDGRGEQAHLKHFHLKRIRSLMLQQITCSAGCSIRLRSGANKRMGAMTSSRTSLNAAPSPSPLLSRRHCLNWAAAGLTAPLLQACGGSDSGASALFSVPPALPPQADPESVRWFRAAALEKLGQGDSAPTAISAAVLVDDRVVWREAFGYADRENGLLATPDTRVNIGSVSKMFAAMAVMMLRDQGRLALDQPLHELLPAFRMRSPEYRRVTVRHLISHSSGFPGTNSRNVFNFVPILNYGADTMRSLESSRLKHEPGELAVYCNDGFTMVEPLVLELTGMSFPEFAQRHFFDPLGMSLTGYALAPAAEGTFVHPYREGKRLPQEMPAPFATGGAISTPTDMMKLARMFLDNGMYEGRRIISADAVREMAINQGPRARINPTPRTLEVGLGWDTVAQAGMEAGGLHAWSKNGGTAFFTSEFFVLPEARMAMMVNGNATSYGSRALIEGMLLRTAAERGVIRSLPPALAPTVPALVRPAPDTAARVGVYANHNGPFQVFAADDGSLTVRKLGENGWNTVQSNMRARNDGRWWTDGESTRCYRFQTVDGHRYLIVRILAPNRLYWEESPQGEWLAPLNTPLPPAWQARVGSRWICLNDSPESVTRRFGPLMLQINTLAEMPGYLLWDNEQLLRVINDNEAGMTVKVPVNEGRDLSEWRMVIVNGQEELHTGTLVFQRLPTV